MKISVIVPVYKAEKYIEECINSVLSQTYQNFELILINDGSPDKSGQICDDYAKQFDNIKVYHKQNGGVSSARNMGIEKSSGEWILFLDADDKLYSQCLETCINIVQQNDLDILQFWHSRSKRYNETLYCQPLSSNAFLETRFNVCIGASIFKSSLIKSNHILFPENIKLAEDQVFMLKSILHAKKIEIIDTILYFYRSHANSATASINQEEMYRSSLFLLNFKQQYPETAHQLDNSILSFAYYIISKDNNYDKILKQFYKNANIQHCDRVTTTAKAFYYCAKFNWTLASTFIRTYQKIRTLKWKN